MKRKSTSHILLAIIILAAMIVIGRTIRQGKADSLQDPYTEIISVKGLMAQPTTFTRQIEETGVLVGNKEAMVSAETGGRVLQIAANVGETVKLGDPLVRLDDELYNLEAARAKIAHDKANLDLARLERLYAQNSVSESDLENARLAAKGAEVQYRMALKTYQDATIRAPFSGTVAAKLTEVGQMVERGMPVLQLVDLGTLKLNVQLAETDITHISEGAPVTIIVDAVGDTLVGKVTAIGSRAAEGSRTFPVEISLPGGDNLRSGMFARAVIRAALIPNAILLPRAALLPDAGNTVVYLARGGSAEKIRVRQVGTNGDQVAVEGLAPGDTVITTGNQMISQGTQVNLVMEDGR